MILRAEEALNSTNARTRQFIQELVSKLADGYYESVDLSFIGNFLLTYSEEELTGYTFPKDILISLCSICYKLTEWQCPKCAIDKGLRYPVCDNFACEARHGAIYKCGL